MIHGVKVLDLSRVLAGPLCGMMLGDLGADVVKVERHGTGDESRGWGPPFDSDGESAYYLCCNRNKLSLAVDLENPADQALLRTLVLQADVVLDNFRPGTLERRGLNPIALLEESPNLIWCTITGFGMASTRPGYDFVVQGESGWMAITGEPDGEPMKAGVALADVLAGKDATISILAALAARAMRPLTAADRRLSVSLAHSATSALVNVAQNALVSGAESRRWGNAHANLVPYQLFRASDRHLVVAVGSDGQWRACCEAVGLPALRDDPRLATNSGRLANRQHVVRELSDRLAQDSASAWIARLTAAGVPCGVIRTPIEALADLSASARTGVAPQAPGTVRLAPPKLDEHGALIRRTGWNAFAEVTSIG